jgi:hypothetical protein
VIKVIVGNGDKVDVAGYVKVALAEGIFSKVRKAGVGLVIDIEAAVEQERAETAAGDDEAGAADHGAGAQRMDLDRVRRRSKRSRRAPHVAALR